MAGGRVRFVLGIAVALLATAARAEPSFTCEAQGTEWHVSGSATTKMSCQFTCALKQADGEVNNLACTALVAPGMATNMPCQGFLAGKHWKSAELVAELCSQVP